MTVLENIATIKLINPINPIIAPIIINGIPIMPIPVKKRSAKPIVGAHPQPLSVNAKPVETASVFVFTSLLGTEPTPWEFVRINNIIIKFFAESEIPFID